MAPPKSLEKAETTNKNIDAINPMGLQTMIDLFCICYAYDPNECQLDEYSPFRDHRIKNQIRGQTRKQAEQAEGFDE